MDKIAGQPTAAWLGNWNPQIESDTKKYVWSKTRAGGLPVMVAYNLPFRDCGSYSAGGSRTPERYRAWIDGLAAGIGSRRAVVVLEPDGLPLLKKCLTPAQQQQRIDLVKYAIEKLAALPGAAVYVDAGHSAWIDAPEMAVRLKAAGIDQRRRVRAERLELPGDARPHQVRPRAVGAAGRQALHHRHQPQRQRSAAVQGRRRARLVQPRRTRARRTRRRPRPAIR